MAAVKHARGVKLLIKVGNGASPEVFATYCTINAARGITFSADTNDQIIPDCENPDAVAWVGREKVSLSSTISGAGMLNTPDVETFFNWLASEETKNVEVVVDVPSADGGVVFTGAYHLTSFEITGDRGAKMEASIELVSDGEITVEDNT